MTNKKFFLLDENFVRDVRYKTLKGMENGRIMSSYYLDMLAVGAENCGRITLHGKNWGFATPADEVAMMIDAYATEVPFIAMTMQKCQQLGLIKITDNEIQFDFDERYFIGETI